MQQFVLDLAQRGVRIEIVAFRVSPDVARVLSKLTLVAEIPGPFLVRFLWFWLYTTIYLAVRSKVPTISCGAITGVRTDAIWLHFWHHEHLMSTGWFCSWQGSPIRFVIQSVARFVAWVAEAWSLAVVATPILVAVSDSQARALRNVYGTRIVLCLPNPVNYSYMPRETKPSDTRRIIFLGGEWGRKGLRLAALAANASGRRQQARIELLVIGRGARSTISELQRLDWLDVHHISWTDDVPKFLRTADLMVSASRYETFAMAGHESLGAGVPVVTSDVHGLSDAVRATRLGQVVPRNVKSFESAISTELWRRTYTVAERRGAAAWIRKHYDSHAIARARMELISTLRNRDAG
jgi:glycosyltransferase involved in cell wall biosynthesis